MTGLRSEPCSKCAALEHDRERLTSTLRATTAELHRVRREIAALRIAAVTCNWTETEDGDAMVWETGCDNRFQFNEGGPAENGCDFCPYCGSAISIARPPDMCDKCRAGQPPLDSPCNRRDCPVPF